jgi:hypothetical protein
MKNAKATLETFQVPGISNGDQDAVGWILHHEYLGAIGEHLGIKGLRLRVGNIQIGDANTLQGIFPEPRFNSWAIAEIHVLNPRLVPNGRRDDFEQNTHYTNLITHIVPKAKAIAKACRASSADRAQHRRQTTPQLIQANGAKMDWQRAKSFLIAHASKPLTKVHRINIRKLLQKRTPTYSQVMQLLTDSGASDRPPP